MPLKSESKRRSRGTGHIYKEGKRFYLRIVVEGKIKTTMLRNESTGEPCTNMVDAEKSAAHYKKILLAETKEELALEVQKIKKLRKQSGLLLIDAWKTYLDQTERPDSAASTLKNHCGVFTQFHNWIKNNAPNKKYVADIDEDLARSFFSNFWKTGISAKRYNDVLMSLRLVFRHLSLPALLDSNPFDRLKKQEQHIVSRNEFSQEQVEAIFNGFEKGFFYETEIEAPAIGGKRQRIKTKREFKPLNKEEMRILLHLCCWTGCRGQDGCLMQWKNVDFERNIISYIPRKTARKTGGKAVTLPLHPHLRDALREAENLAESETSGNAYILPKMAERYNHNPSGIQKDVMKIIRCATGVATKTMEISGRRKLAANLYSLHSFRHTFVSFCANAGVPLAIVAEIVGHGNPIMTRHYSHISTEAKQKAIQTLPNLNSDTVIAIEDRSIQLKNAITAATPEQIEQIKAILNME